MKITAITQVGVLFALACKPPAPALGDAGASGSARDAAALTRPTSPQQIVAQKSTAARKPPPHTFDLLSEVVAPGSTTTQSTNLPAGWTVTGVPQVVGKGFAIVSAETRRAPGQPDAYVVVAKNVGTAPARFVADVPCSGCP